MSQPCRPTAVSTVLTAFVAAVMVLAGLLTAASTEPAAAASAGERIFTRVGSLPRLPDDALRALGPKIRRAPNGLEHESGTVVMVSQARQLWQFFPYLTPERQIRTAIVVRDLDTMRIRRALDVGRLGRGTFNGGGDWMHASTEHKIYLFSPGDEGLLEIDLRSFASRVLPLEPLEGSGDVVGSLGGISYLPQQKRLLLLFSNGSLLGSPAQILLVQVNPETGVADGRRVLRSCDYQLYSVGPRGPLQAEVLQRDGFLYVPCSRGADTAIVVRIAMEDLLDGTSAEDFVVGPVNLASALADPVGGRLYLLTLSGAMWVFDTRSEAFVGVVGAGADTTNTKFLGLGIDPSSGRVYFLSSFSGLGVVEGRFFPIPQARTDPSLASDGSARIYADPLTSRIFVMPGRSDTRPVREAYAIYRPTPAPIPPGLPDPDLSTSDVQERPGITESTFSTSASGYGARVLLANGVVASLPFPSVGGNSPLADVFVKNLRSNCSFTDRELVVGRVVKVEADTGSTAAQSIAADIDARTRQDLERPSRCDPSLSDPSGNRIFEGIFATAPALAGVVDNQPGASPRWDREPALCTSGEGQPPVTATGRDNGSVPLGRSAVSCVVPDGKQVLSAQAEGGLDGPVSIGRAVTTVQTRRGPGGISSVVTAIASDVSLAGVVSIAEIRSEATSRSNGRPSKAPLAEHRVSLRGVRIAGDLVCSSDCDVASTLNQLNGIAAGRVQFRAGVGGADSRLVRGTKRGALSAVQKSAERQASDQALVGDFTVEVPGLEMTVYNDNLTWGRSRQVYQFAGVATAANYNVVRLPQGRPAPPVDLPQVVGVASIDESGGMGPTGSPEQESPAATRDQTQATAGVASLFRNGVAALARGVRVFWNDPRQALLLLTTWLLLGLPVLLGRRRRLLGQLTVDVLAPPAPSTPRGI